MKNTVEEIGLIHRDSTFYRKGNMALRFYLPIEILLAKLQYGCFVQKVHLFASLFSFSTFSYSVYREKTKENEIKKKSISDEIKKETAPHRGKRCFSFKICI